MSSSRIELLEVVELHHVHGPVVLVLLYHLHQLLGQQVQLADAVVAHLHLLSVDQQVVRHLVLQLLLLELQYFVLLLQVVQVPGRGLQLFLQPRDLQLHLFDGVI